jgi:hypothetical protein
MLSWENLIHSFKMYTLPFVTCRHARPSLPTSPVYIEQHAFQIGIIGRIFIFNTSHIANMFGLHIAMVKIEIETEIVYNMYRMRRFTTSTICAGCCLWALPTMPHKKLTSQG